MKKVIFVLLSILFILSTPKNILCETQPIVSIPKAIKNYVDFYNKSDYSIYKLDLINPANHTVNYVIYTISPDWIIVYYDKEGSLGPNERKTITIYARPSIKTTKAASFLVSFYDGIKTSSEVYLSPFIVYKLPENFKQPSLQEISIYPEREVKEGGDLVIFISIYNPNDFEITVPIYINLSFGLYKELFANVSPGTNIIQQSFIVPTGLNVSEFEVKVIAGNIILQRNLTVLKEVVTPKIEERDGYIIITNPSTTKILIYEYEIPYSNWDLLVYRLYPYPKEYIVRDGKIYARWEIVLLPQESYVIKKQIDIYFILVLGIIVALFIAFLIGLLRPNVEIRKEIVRLSLNEGILRVAIYIKNKSVLPIKYVIIRDRIPSELKVKKYDVSSPSGVYKEDKETILEWSYEYIKPKEEIIISYTIEIPKEIKQKVLSLPPASIVYNYLYMSEKIAASNTISITIIA
ncbi:MAG: hypothetical protein BXU00_03205 [Candidatus Nanoclepta minutus]|uniref:Uncharacterized protein n=1 Tax=Candidatus Nanoclepta minutus TaxID=1940235 RepID=A0A397WMH5_9ARCH|nr:MAG: hypothetical protein BXU00_03205 [Candidatus Nanoclepta minutus]